MLKRLASGVGLVLFAACVTTGPVASERIQATEAAIHEADNSGASKLPAATSYLQLAREELDQGKELSSKGQGHRADLALQRASEDAKLASVLAQKEQLDRETKEIGERLKALQ